MPTINQLYLQSLRYSQQASSYRIFSLAFPYLFPNSLAEYALPRLRVVKFLLQAQHLLRFEDRRFARYDRFRYAYFNLQIRDLSGNRSKQLINKNNQTFTVEELRTALETESLDLDRFLNAVIRYSTNIKGIRPFQSRRRLKLESYIYVLRKPTFFFTFSATDTQQYDLQKHMPYFDDWNATSNTERYKINRRNIRSNPYIATAYFNARFRAFLRLVLTPKFYIKDYQFRYEF